MESHIYNIRQLSCAFPVLWWPKASLSPGWIPTSWMQPVSGVHNSTHQIQAISNVVDKDNCSVVWQPAIGFAALAGGKHIPSKSAYIPII